MRLNPTILFGESSPRHGFLTWNASNASVTSGTLLYAFRRSIIGVFMPVILARQLYSGQISPILLCASESERAPEHMNTCSATKEDFTIACFLDLSFISEDEISKTSASSLVFSLFHPSTRVWSSSPSLLLLPCPQLPSPIPSPSSTMFLAK